MNTCKQAGSSPLPLGLSSHLTCIKLLPVVIISNHLQMPYGAWCAVKPPIQEHQHDWVGFGFGLRCLMTPFFFFFLKGL